MFYEYGINSKANPRTTFAGSDFNIKDLPKTIKFSKGVDGEVNKVVELNTNSYKVANVDIVKFDSIRVIEKEIHKLDPTSRKGGRKKTNKKKRRTRKKTKRKTKRRRRRRKRNTRKK